MREEIMVLSRTKYKRKKKIIETAYQMFTENGISSTSMNDIAEACEITRRTIYNYFNSKTDLLTYLMVDVTEDVDVDFHVDYDDKITAIENMRKVLNTNFDSYYKHMSAFLFITQVRIYLSYRLKKSIDATDDRSSELHKAFIEEIMNIIEKGHEDGTIKKLDMEVEETSKLIYQSLYGYLSNITIGAKIARAKYNRKCQNFEAMVIGFLESK
ncbi:AcrR family transcriptional regulator [Bacilli bacterium PM5-3]|nr:AcrR family transcriptional regulator [Bacilli bacterium PM5-3]MDH6603318.1 AcrR family transcriptional regulator [Bacilli bacterium PM5-9]